MGHIGLQPDILRNMIPSTQPASGEASQAQEHILEPATPVSSGLVLYLVVFSDTSWASSYVKLNTIFFHTMARVLEATDPSQQDTGAFSAGQRLGDVGQIF